FAIGYHLGAAGIAGVLLIYLVKGHPLARRWTLVLSVIALIMAISRINSLRAQASPAQLADAVLQIALACAFIVLLPTESSLRYFDLGCPFCGVYQAKAVNFLFSRIKCKNCGRAWKLHDHGVEVEARVFD